MKHPFSTFLAIIGGITLVILIIAIALGIFSWMGKGRVPGKTILEVNFERGLIEYVPDDPVAKAMLNKYLKVRDVVEALERAARDDRVVGLIARVGAGKMGLAQIQEIRDAVSQFRKSGKPAIAYAETFGEFGPGNGAYYLASAFDPIYMQPSGDIGITGLIFESPFLRGTLDKLGIVPRMDHRYEYKNAMNIFTEKKYTPAHREATEAVMQSQFNQMVEGIGRERKRSADQVRALFDQAPFLGSEAVEAGLVDSLAYWDEVVESLQQKFGTSARRLDLVKYLKRAGRPYEKGKTIALIYGVGGVQRGKSGFDPVFGSATMGAETVTAAFRAAIKDQSVKAILFRVDSPGGSYVASDAIWRETLHARDAGKPVIVSMGDVAGSGGYFVAMAADKIVAQPGTITGSIGVLGGKMLTSGFWQKIGLSWDEVHTSKNATMWTGTHDYTPDEWSRFQAWLDRVYNDFTSKVARGRDLPKEKVLEIAKGRIWTGEQAKKLGLVDELGGFPVALRLARQAAGIPAEEEIRLKLFPKKKTLLDMIFGKGPESSGRVAISTVTRLLQEVRPLVRWIGAVRLEPEKEVLAMPEMGWQW